jgi:hypothetical protein
MKCYLCDDEIDPEGPGTLWQATSCFTARKRIRASGKQRDMSDRVVYRYLDTYAHDHCIQRLKRGVSPHQQAML